MFLGNMDIEECQIGYDVTQQWIKSGIYIPNAVLQGGWAEEFMNYVRCYLSIC